MHPRTHTQSHTHTHTLLVMQVIQRKHANPHTNLFYYETSNGLTSRRPYISMAYPRGMKGNTKRQAY